MKRVAMISLLPKIVLAVICALIAYQIALLTWSVYPVKKSTYSWTAPAKTSTDKQLILSTEKLQQQHLFGRYQGDTINIVQQEQTEAPKTRLNLTLVGIVASSEPELSSVIIEHKKVQDSYFIDSEIDDTNATVTEIYSDRIIISVNGEKQTLILDGLEQDNKKMAQIENGQASSRLESRENGSKEIELDRQALLQNPEKLLDYIRISPVREGNQIKGYRVSPGKDPDLFTEAGLEEGDLAIELNGVDLTDISQAMGLMKEFPNMTEMSLTVDRDGELHELFFSIP
tara:strand:+ start:3429 stop:4286 length:858 start_codon:yes stop_codon:yes gene_type:complete